MSTPPWGDEPTGSSPPPPPSGPPAPQPGSPPYQPYGAPSGPYGAPSAPYGTFPATPPTNGLAIASLVVSIGSVVFCCGLPGIVGAILGHVARKQIREEGQAGDGMALGGIIVGWIAFGLSMALLVFYVVVIVILGVWAESVDCHYDSDGTYICD